MRDAATVFTEDWMLCVSQAVWKSPSLRQSITLAASLLTELLEWEIRHEGWDPAWGDDLTEFCHMMSRRSGEDGEDWTQEDAELDDWVWSTAGETLDLYSQLQELSDWDLYADCCLDADEGFKECCDRVELVCRANSMAVAYIHGYVTKSGSEQVS